MKILKFCITVTLTILNFSISAEIITDDFKVMMAPKVAKSTAGYGVIKNKGPEDDTLISICSESLEVMFHKTEIHAGISKMRHLSDVVIPAGEELVLKPMSYHLMLFDFYNESFKTGGTITFFLTFKKAGIIKVNALIVDH